jgi:putative flippase GtrA
MASSFATNLAHTYLLVSVLGPWYVAASVTVTFILLAANFLINDRWSFALRR